MKFFILLFFVLFLVMQEKGYSQQANNKKVWSRVDSLEKKGLYRSAWDEVKDIYNKAIRSKNDEQQIKALIYQLKYRSRIEEDANAININEVDSLAQQASGIQQAILQSMLAEMYWRYTQANRYKLYNRITSSEEKADDIATWSLSHLYDKIAALYKASLQDGAALKNTKLENLTVIADTGKNTLDLRPTLFDLLAQRALEYFTGEEQGVIKPARHFIIDHVAAFDPALAFSRFKLPENDTTDLAYTALKLFQQLIRFHLDDNNSAALIDVDLQRLQFVYRKAVLPGKDSIYVMALEHIVDQYGKTPAADQAVYLLAQWHFSQGMQYDPLDHPQGKDELIKALELCNTIPASRVSEAGIAARRLKDIILRTDISLEAERVNVPDKPFRMLVSYKNATDLWFRVVKLTEDPAIVYKNRNNDKGYLLKQQTVKNWHQAFPDPKDHQTHRAEMKVDGLPHGRYALLVSGNKNFNARNSPVESIIFYVSSISYIENGNGDFLVLNRETGQPLAEAKVNLWNIQYNPDKRKSELELVSSSITDSQGRFHVKKDTRSQSLLPEISWNGDHLFTGQSQWVPYVSSENNTQDTTDQKTYLFTDRSIYRPGQTLYFKGIVFDYYRRTHRGEVVSDKKVTVLLYDANNQKIDSLHLVSNAFGSYAGSFRLPKASLNGFFRLKTADNQAAVLVSVEAYKRPTFTLQWDTVSREYRLGDTISIAGKVKAYSQAVVDGATVDYQVTRRTRIVFPWYRRPAPGFMPYSQTATIAQGTTTTDDLGNFSIDFPAIPDETMDSSFNPVFQYLVSVDVTDISGESHSFSYELPLGYKSLQLQWDVGNRLSIRAMDTLRLSSTSLQGKFLPSRVSVRLYPLEAPETYIRSRYWEQPDEFVMSKADYLKYFPHDEYKNESDPETWVKGDAVLTVEDTTKSNGELLLHGGKIEPGWYVLEATARDKYGQPVKATQYIQLYDDEMKKLPFADPLWLSKEEITAQPGDKVSWLVAGGDNTVFYSQDERLEKIGEVTSGKLDNEVRPVELSVTEADRGGVIRHYVTVKYNRVFAGNVSVQVPWENKQLDIQYETFRDKLLPGAQEKWKMKITGREGQKVSAELLASMYDASLDAFRAHRWNLPDIYPVSYGKVRWRNSHDFNALSSYNIFSPKAPVYPNYEKRYPSFNWFGYSPGRPFPPSPVYARGASVGAVTESVHLRVDAMAKNELQESVEVGFVPDSTASRPDEQTTTVESIRKNFDETAFFFPQLNTNDSGQVIFSFTVPEALTRWKLMLFAHTKDMRYAFSEKEAITQKPLMIQANAPRFVRQGDQLVFSAKISNTSKEDLKGNAQLQLANLATGEAVNSLFKNEDISRPFMVEAGRSTVVKWSLDVPEEYTGALSYKITAAAGNYSDGEQNALPVLTNRILVTESLPLFFNGNGNHIVDFAAIKKMDQSPTLLPLGMTIEYTGNPMWYAVQALPFLDETKRQSADAYFNQVYANILSDFIAGNIPHFNEVMQQWLAKDTNALKSPLQKNEELKSVLLQETPWVEVAQQESAQKAKIAGWFSDREAAGRVDGAIRKLKDMQLSNGGFSWFKDMPDDRYITQKILAGIGHLIQLKAVSAKTLTALQPIISKGVPYLDARMKEAYDVLIKQEAEKPHLGPVDIQYLYMRSFFPNVIMNDSVKAAYDYYKKLAAGEWLNQPVHLQAMLALAMNRWGDASSAKAILKSLSETAIRDDIKGMHWKGSPVYYRWYQAPVETQAVCIEAFNEINHDEKTVDALRRWLLSQKQTQHWVTTAATADAVYALLLTGTQWAASSPDVRVQTGKQAFSFEAKNGLGLQYNKVSIPGKDITAGMEKVHVEIKNAAKNQPTWGALYFQYFENMNKLDNTGNGLSVTREISLEQTTPDGPKLIPVNENMSLQVGDKIQVRMTIKVAQDMDYVHLKDVRASSMEPLQTISRYRWQGGVGYYSTVTDAAVHFYFSHLPRGTYVFTYPVYITQAGNFTGGLSTLECLYAPSMRAHSEGVDVHVNGQ